MKNMQNGFLKFLKTFILVFTTSFCLAQTSTFRLKTADSLFQAKQYTQSFDHYEAVLQNKEYTESMLLKMAFIQEGLGNIGNALYYLNLYESATHDEAASIKMQELADKYDLLGYAPSDGERALNWYARFSPYISIFLGALCVLLLSIAFHQSIRKNERPVVPVSLLSLVLIILFVHLNYGGDVSAGVVAHSNTHVMKGPSAGSSVVDVIDGGHRIEVVGRQDVWLKVLWDGSVAYVKENNILPITL
jgi:hypothetical protein